MANPQQPELARSRRVPALDPDASETVLSGAGPAPFDRPAAPVPEHNLPGHHPEHEQDKPLGRFVARARARAAEPRPPSALARRVSGVATAPLRVAERVLGGLRRRL